jgi:hypothetical protein
VEELVRKGESVTDKGREDYAFARILLSEIKKRKERWSSDETNEGWVQ